VETPAEKDGVIALIYEFGELLYFCVHVIFSPSIAIPAALP
jgi:hypothetical protein